MLISHFADALGQVKDCAKAFRLQSNASVTTRAKLDTLIDLSSAMYSELRAIRAHVDLIKKEEDELGVEEYAEDETQN